MNKYVAMWGLSRSMTQKVKFSLCLTKHHTMKTYGGGVVSIAPFVLNLGTKLI